MTTSSSSSSAAPPWADASSSASKRPAPIEDHRGTIAGGAAAMDDDGLLLAPASTLDEPVSETIMRDVRAVGAKLRAVLIPLDRTVSSVCVAAVDTPPRRLGGKNNIIPEKIRAPPPPSFLKIYIRRV